MVNDIQWLQEFYQRHCDGEWEQSRGIAIGTLDNPGWRVRIDLSDLAGKGGAEPDLLEVAGQPPGPTNGNIGGLRWMHCEVKGSQFLGAGDPNSLADIIACFRRWQGEGLVR